MPATQIRRPFRVKTPLGDDALLLESFEGHERISTPYRYVLKVLSENANIDMAALLEKPAVLSIMLNDEAERHIHGNISRFRLLEAADDGLASYEMEIVPWIWFLNLFQDCRIFQNKSIPDIIKAVFNGRGFTGYKDSLQGTYEPLDYCVQYRETDFNFVSRLMEEEGIFYFFEQSESEHKLVLADQNSTFAACPHQDTARFLPAKGGSLDEEIVHTIAAEVRVEIATASMTDYDFEKPNTSLYATLSGSGTGEEYDYPGKYKTKAAGDRYARIRMEEKEVQLSILQGSGNCSGFECAYKFTLTDHYRDALNQEYVIAALDQRGVNSSYRAGEPDPYDYKNHFQAIPASVVFRPPRLARKPFVRGSQTAVVVGKAGEEIWVDQYGRVKVQFFWDRLGNADENSSCWVRVGQFWAGKQWGAIFTPRIGQEVIVTFLEGDPDQPLITGSVYNADQMPPYTLPDMMTKSTIKSMSTKGGGGFNEFRFEDHKGSEQIFLHGEKNLDIRIKNDRMEFIGNNHNLNVVNDKMQKIGRDDHSEIVRDQIEKIGRDHNVAVEGKSAMKITGSHSMNVTGDVIEEFKANHSSQVTQNLYLKALQVVIEASVGMTLKVGGNFITLDPSGIAISGTPIVQINSAGSALSGSPGSLVAPLSPTAPVEADKADPGAVTNAPTAQTQSTASMHLDTISPVTGVRELRSAATSGPTHDPNAPANVDKTHWIEIELVNEAGEPITGEPFRITLPDGKVYDGTTDNKGCARVEHIDPGSCQVTFPNLDQDAWS